MLGIMHQDPIPGFVFRRPAPGDPFIPFVRTLELRIHVDYYAAVIEQPVMDELADAEFGDFIYHARDKLNYDISLLSVIITKLT